MTHQSVSIASFFSEGKDRVLLDVRTPAEYAQAHIPGAINLPLFSNEERVIVGTLYKQQSPEAAFLQGLEFAGAKMADYVRQANQFAPGRRVAIHCWRGGQRSGSISWLLGFAGFDVWTLQGGYKAYRNYVLNAFASCKLPLLVLGGATGSGKTAVLHALKNQGEQILDLEALAHHKGSAFGALGEQPQPTVEQFENDLYAACQALDPQRRIWVENESRAIGRVYQPEGFWELFRHSPHIELAIPFEQRVAYLVEVYANHPVDDLRESFSKIERRLGGQHLKAALEALDQHDFAEAATIALRYYDKAYVHANTKCAFEPFWKLPVTTFSPPAIASSLIAFANQHGI